MNNAMTHSQRQKYVEAHYRRRITCGSEIPTIFTVINKRMIPITRPEHLISNHDVNTGYSVTQ